MDVNDVPMHLKEIVPYLQTFEKLLNEYELDRRHAIIKFILEKECIDYMVFGVETEEQLKNISEKLILPIHWKWIYKSEKMLNEVKYKL